MVWGPFWELSAPIWRVWKAQNTLWRSQSHPEGVWSAQGWSRVGSGADFGPNLVPTWAHLGTQNRTKKDSKMSQFLHGLRNPTWTGFGRALGTKMGLCWHPKSISKWMLTRKGQFHKFIKKLDRFLIFLELAEGKVCLKIGRKIGPKA